MAIKPRTKIVQPVTTSVVKMGDALAQDMGSVPILWHNPNIADGEVSVKSSCTHARRNRKRIPREKSGVPTPRVLRVHSILKTQTVLQ